MDREKTCTEATVTQCHEELVNLDVERNITCEHEQLHKNTARSIQDLRPRGAGDNPEISMDVQNSKLLPT